jgi:CxxC motif-containing protein (DUF1111 family)
MKTESSFSSARWIIQKALPVLAIFAVAACTASDAPVSAILPGEAIPALSDANRGRFLLGRALFERIATQDEGLGPLYNQDRCSSCHDRPTVGGASSASVRVLKATRFMDGRCDRLEALGGDNIQLRVTELFAAHGFGAEDVPLEATDSGYVTAPSLFGLGLIEAIPDSVLLSIADPEDRDGDGISGRLPRMADQRSARFGRKGDAASVEDFVESALRFELGFTTPRYPEEEARNGVPIPEGVDPMPDPEIDAETLGLLTDYVRFLGAPAPEFLGRGPAADSVSQGEALFDQIGCTQCHRPELRTGNAEEPALRDQVIRLYSDLLLHDFGNGVGDLCGSDALPGEFRTPPLWGLRYREHFLHDGSVTDLVEVIDRHSGEAILARVRFQGLTPQAQMMVLRFLRSL